MKPGNKSQTIKEKIIRDSLKHLRIKIKKSGLRDDFIAKNAGLSPSYFNEIKHGRKISRNIIELLNRINETIDSKVKF